MIDVAEPIEWDGCRLEWRQDALPELAWLRDRTIDTVRLVEYRGSVNGLQFLLRPRMRGALQRT